MMRVIQFGGGLGDVFLSVFNTNAYVQLEALPPEERAQIVLLSANPGIEDLFRWHPKASQLDLFRIGSGDPWGSEQRRARGIKEPTEVLHRGGSPVTFYPSPEDKVLVNSMPRPYVVFALSAGHPAINIPLPLAEEAADVAENRNLSIVTVGRTYLNVIRNFNDGTEGTIPREEVRLKPRPRLVDTIDRLSVPGLAALVHGASAVLSCHSSTMILSWLYRKPIFAVFHEMKQNEWDGTFSTTFGKNFPETKGIPIGRWGKDTFDRFLSDHAAHP